ncbi:glucuronate isomerase [Gorillibacterium sp. CAU 1737]|uniref:glucuronate isomerase n=1 Tax=Gorillibacterium sp. CAU 1737 TaxID=3140362 RepID=UPI0032603400
MFLEDNFLLTSPTARDLFHHYAKEMPILDYHCHLDPKEIYENRAFPNLTAAWLSGDHYKWRLMRANGIDERFITGDASDEEKFYAWAKTVPMTIGNPLYSWTHLELRRFFGIDERLTERTAPAIWEAVNQQLASPAFKRRELIKRSKVAALCTTDDPADSLSCHRLLAEEETAFRVYPTYRPDKALNLDSPGFLDWLSLLEAASGRSVTSFRDLLEALRGRMQVFHEHGCRLSDHALDTLHYQAGSEADVERIFQKRRAGASLSAEEVTVYRTELLSALIGFYRELGWTMQLHLHAFRNHNSRLLRQLGPDAGFDGIQDLPLAQALSRLLDRAEREQGLPKTILYSLNPNDYPVLVTLMACYQGEMPGKLQLGSGWWFNDTYSGMREQLTKLAENGLLSRFVGMLTDSRSFLSYTRHEYFRRVLCGWLGELAMRGEAPDDLDLLGGMVQDIAYRNAERYFNFPV